MPQRSIAARLSVNFWAVPCEISERHGGRPDYVGDRKNHASQVAHQWSGALARGRVALSSGRLYSACSGPEGHAYWLRTRCLRSVHGLYRRKECSQLPAFCSRSEEHTSELQS